MHLAVVVLHIESLGLEHSLLHTLLREVLNKRLVLGKAFECTIQQQCTFLNLGRVFACHHAARIAEQLSDKFALGVVNTLHIGLELVEQLILAARHWTRNDKRSTCVVNKHRVHLIDDGIVVRALNAILGNHCHVVAQVVETKLAVGTECNVAVIGVATLGAVGLGLVDTCHAQAVEHVKRTHPLRVTFGEVVIDGYHVNTASRKGVEEYGQGCNQRLTFTSSHLGNLTLMKHRAANELHVVVNHVPRHLIAAGLPVVIVDGFVALYVEEVVAIGSQLAVEVGSCNLDGFVLGKAACCILHNGKYHRKHVVEFIFYALENLFLEFVDFSPQRFSFLIIQRFDFGFNACNLVALRFHILLNLLLDSGTACTQLIVRQLLYLGINLLNFTHVGHEFLQVTIALVAED